MPQIPTNRSPGAWLLGLLALLVALIVAGGWLHLNSQQAEAKRLAEEMLTHIDTVKADQIAQWMRERRADAAAALDLPLARRYLQAPHDPATRQEMQQWLSRSQGAYGYSAVALFDAAGRLLLHATAVQAPWQDAAFLVEAGEHARAAASARDVVFYDLHELPDQFIHMSFAAPVGLSPQPDRPAAGALLFVIDPRSFLYPLIQTWPTPSPSAETLLIRREGDEVVFLNDLRHRADTALKLRRPIAAPPAFRLRWPPRDGKAWSKAQPIIGASRFSPRYAQLPARPGAWWPRWTRTKCMPRSANRPGPPGC